MAVWDPGQYTRFGDYRLRPGIDLLSRIPDIEPKLVWDLGCGTGNITEIIARRWPNAKVVGVDSSAEMLAKAKSIPDVEWVHADIASWNPPEIPDIIYSNATLHWLPGHDTLFPRLVDRLRPGGILAVQMPRNVHAASHQEITVVSNDSRWRAELGAVLGSMPMAAEPADYYRWVNNCVSSIDVWETEYLHVLEGANAVAEWTKGSVLKPFLDALPTDRRGEFFDEYARRLGVAYPKQPDGRTLFPFRRLFLIAQR
jgi:trans-aconitate 2-methyltransferase